MRALDRPTLVGAVFTAGLLRALVSPETPRVIATVAALARRRLGPAPVRPWHREPCDDDECRRCPVLR